MEQSFESRVESRRNQEAAKVRQEAPRRKRPLHVESARYAPPQKKTRVFRNVVDEAGEATARTAPVKQFTTKRRRRPQAIVTQSAAKARPAAVKPAEPVRRIAAKPSSRRISPPKRKLQPKPTEAARYKIQVSAEPEELEEPEPEEGDLFLALRSRSSRGAVLLMEEEIKRFVQSQEEDASMVFPGKHEEYVLAVANRFLLQVHRLPEGTQIQITSDAQLPLVGLRDCVFGRKQALCDDVLQDYLEEYERDVTKGTDTHFNWGRIDAIQPDELVQDIPEKNVGLKHIAVVIFKKEHSGEEMTVEARKMLKMCADDRNAIGAEFIRMDEKTCMLILEDVNVVEAVLATSKNLKMNVKSLIDAPDDILQRSGFEEFTG